MGVHGVYCFSSMGETSLLLVNWPMPNPPVPTATRLSQRCATWLRPLAPARSFVSIGDVGVTVAFLATNAARLNTSEPL